MRHAEAEGVLSIDAGCLQVNLYYHPDAFESLDAAFDPQRNADYAGRFLRQLYAESGDWRTATGLYHSRTPTLSVPYRDRVAHALQDIHLPTIPSSGQSSVLAKLVDAWRSTLPTGDALRFRTVNDWGCAFLGAGTDAPIHVDSKARKIDRFEVTFSAVEQRNSLMNEAVIAGRYRDNRDLAHAIASHPPFHRPPSPQLCWRSTARVLQSGIKSSAPD